MALETFDIVIRERGARAVSRGIDDVAKSGRSAARDVNFLRSALGGLTAAFAVRELASRADAFTLLGNRVRVFSKDAEETADSVDKLIEVAIGARVPLDAVASTFQRLSLVTRSQGISAETTIGFVDALSKAVIVSGATAQEAEGALRQLSQGYAANRLSGQEFNAVAEQTPRIAKAIADELGVALDELRALVKSTDDAVITTEVLNRSFERLAKEMEDEFGRIDVTIGQAFTNLSTATTVFIGRLNTTVGASNVVVKAIQSVASTLLRLSKELKAGSSSVKALQFAINALAIGGFLFLARTAIPAAIAALKAFNVALLTNPLTGFLTLLTLLASAAFTFRDSLFSIGDTEVTLSSLASTLTEDVGGAVDGLIGKFTEVDDFEFQLPGFTRLASGVTAIFNTIAKVGVEALKDIPRALLNVLVVLGRAPGLIIDALTGEVDFKTVGKALIAGLNSGLRSTQLDVVQIFTDELDATETSWNAFWKQIGESEFVKRAGDRAAKNLVDRINTQLDQLIADRTDLFGGDTSTDLPTGTSARPDTSGDDAAEKAAEAIRGLRGELDPTIEIFNEYEDRLMQLVEAYNLGVISGDEFADLQRRIAEAAAEAREELDRQQGFPGLTGVDAAVQGAKEAFRSLREDLGTETQIIQEGFETAFSSASDAIADFVETGKFDFKGFARSLVSDISRIITKLILLQILQVATGTGGAGAGAGAASGAAAGAAGGGGFLSTLFGGGRAGGGPVSPGRSFLVGERGPELFTPPQTGTIVPNGQLGMPPINVQVVNVDDPSSVPSAMRSREGEQVILNTISRNRGKIRQIVA